MVGKIFHQIPQLFLSLIHPPHSSITSLELGIITTIINLGQQISIIFDYQHIINQEFRFVFAFIQYCLFVDTNLFAQQLQNLIIQAFIVNILFIILFGFMLIQQSKTGYFKNNEFMHTIVVYYPQIFLIPVFYSSLKYILTSQTIEYIYVILILINIATVVFIKTLHAYFCRAKQLMGNSNIFLLNNQKFINIFREVILFATIILKIEQIATAIRLVILSSKISIFITQLFRQQNCQIYTHIYVLALVTNFSLYFQAAICEYLIYCCLSCAIVQHLLELNFYYFLFNWKNENIITLQILETLKRQKNQKSDLILLSIYKIHKRSHCKCQNIQKMISCLFKKMIKKSQNQDEILLYCDYIKEHYPLKASIQILKTKNTNYYFRSASMVLLKELNQQSQHLSQINPQLRQLNDRENFPKLNTKSVYQTIGVPDQLFPLFNIIIKQKINFWIHLVKGYIHIQDCLDDILRLSQFMLDCKSKIEELYDLTHRKLVNSDHKDVIGMKILQIYYCIIYDNKYISFHLQQEINEQLKADQLLQNEFLNSYKLAKNKVFIFQSSLVRNKGELMNLNRKKLSYYFEVNEKTIQNLKFYAQLMPEFISRGHAQFVKQFLQRGYTMHEDQPLNSFLQNTEGYIESCQLNFCYYYTQDDFLMNLILSKNQYRDILIFGVDGVILGISKQFYEEVVNQNIALGTLTHSTKDSIQEQISKVQYFLSLKPLIQFYIPNITEQIETFQKESQMTKQNFLNNIKSTWMIPYNHNDCLNFSGQLLNQYKQVQRKTFQQKSAIIHNHPLEDINNDKPNYSTQFLKQKKAEETYIYSSDIFDQFDGKLDINDISILLLHPSMQNQLFDFVDFGDVSKSQFQLTLQYNIEFNYLQYEHGKYGYFVLTIQDYKTLNTASILSSPSARYVPIKLEGKDDSVNQEFSQQQMHQIDIQSRQEQELSEPKQDTKIQYHNSLIKECDQLNFSDLNQEQLQLKYAQKSTDPYFQIDTFRGNNQGQTTLIQKSKFSENFNLEDADLNDHQSQTVKKQKQDALRQKQQRKVSQFHKGKKNINQSKRMVQPEDFNHDFASNPSKSSVTSTFKETQVLIEQLYFKTTLIVPLKKIGLTLSLFLLSILLCCILNCLSINNNLSQQLLGVQRLVSPQNISYFYSSVYYQLWSQELHTKNIIPLSPFQYQNNINTLGAMFQNGRIYLPNLNIDVPNQAESQGIYDFQINFIINNQQVTKTQKKEDFYIMLNQAIEQEYRDFLSDSSTTLYQLYTNGFVRQNIVDLFSEINNLVVKVIADTENSLYSGQQTFTTEIFIQLTCIMFILFVTLRYWIFIDQLQKSIIFLLSMVNENQALKYITTLNLFKQCLEDQYSNKWIQIDFNEIELNFDKIEKIIPLDNVVKKNNKSENSLYSRITQTKYYSKSNFLILSVILLSWVLFSITGYIIFLSNNNSFQPSLLATLKYGQFRIKMDITGLLGGIAKTENLLENNNLDFINQTQVITLLYDCKSQLVQLMEDVALTILSKEASNSDSNQFDQFLNGNICEQLKWETTKSCDPSKQSSPYNSSDAIYNIMEHGILGYTSALVKYLDQDFDYEFQNFKYDVAENNRLAVKSTNFENYFLSYYCDIQDNFLRFLNQFKVDNEQIAQQNQFVMELYYILAGSLYVIILSILFLIWINYFDRRIARIRQVLVLVHSDLLLNPNMKNRAKLILKWLY